MLTSSTIKILLASVFVNETLLSRRKLSLPKNRERSSWPCRSLQATMTISDCMATRPWCLRQCHGDVAVINTVGFDDQQLKWTSMATRHLLRPHMHQVRDTLIANSQAPFCVAQSSTPTPGHNDQNQHVHQLVHMKLPLGHSQSTVRQKLACGLFQMGYIA